MNIGFWACTIIIPIFLLVALYLTVTKEKSAKLLHGFGKLTEAEQNLYDKAQIVKDVRNNILIWTAIMVIGAICSWLISKYAAVVAFFLVIVLFLSDLHMDAYAACEKYRIK